MTYAPPVAYARLEKGTLDMATDRRRALPTRESLNQVIFDDLMFGWPRLPHGHGIVGRITEVDAVAGIPPPKENWK